MTPVIPFFVVAFMATLTIAMGQAMSAQPDPAELMPKPLNAVIVGGLGWSALVMTAVNSTVHFGLVIPAIAGAALYAAFRIMSTTNFTRFYRFALPLGLVTIMSTVAVASQYFTVRSLS